MRFGSQRLILPHGATGPIHGTTVLQDSLGIGQISKGHICQVICCITYMRFSYNATVFLHKRLIFIIITYVLSIINLHHTFHMFTISCYVWHSCEVFLARICQQGEKAEVVTTVGITIPKQGLPCLTNRWVPSQDITNTND